MYCFVRYMFQFCTSGNLHYTEDKFSGGINTCWNKCECELAACTELVCWWLVLGIILTGQILVKAQEKEENGRNFALRQHVPPNGGLNPFPLHTGAGWWKAAGSLQYSSLVDGSCTQAKTRSAAQHPRRAKDTFHFKDIYLSAALLECPFLLLCMLFWSKLDMHSCIVITTLYDWIT